MQENGFKVKVDLLIRILSVLCFLFMFMAMFTIHAMGFSISLSFYNLILGLNISGYDILPANPNLIIILVLLIVIVATLSIPYRKLTNPRKALISLIAAMVTLINVVAEKRILFRDFEGWMETTIFYSVLVFFLIVIIVLSFLVLVQRIHFDTDLISVFTSDKIKQAFICFGKGILNVLCNIGIHMKNTFFEVIQSLKEEPKKHNEKTGKKYCSRCGAKITPGSHYCSKCGNKLDA